MGVVREVTEAAVVEGKVLDADLGELRLDVLANVALLDLVDLFERGEQVG